MTREQFLEAMGHLFDAAQEVDVVHLLAEHMDDFADGLANGVLMASLAKLAQEKP